MRRCQGDKDATVEPRTPHTKNVGDPGFGQACNTAPMLLGSGKAGGASESGPDSISAMQQLLICA